MLRGLIEKKEPFKKKYGVGNRLFKKNSQNGLKMKCFFLLLLIMKNKNKLFEKKKKKKLKYMPKNKKQKKKKNEICPGSSVGRAQDF
jgi:hypothetical protein